MSIASIDYFTIIVEDGRHRIVRHDGAPLCTEPPPAPKPKPRRPRAAETGWLLAPPPRVRDPYVVRRERLRREAERRARLDGLLPDGAQLRSWRVEQGLSQRDLAACAGLPRSLVAAAESGARLALAARQRMAAALGHPVEPPEERP